MQFTVSISSRRIKQVTSIATIIVAAGILVACTSEDSNKGQTQENKQQQAATEQLVKNQPIPQLSYSQMRQNLIEIETAQAQGVQTTSFFFNQGVVDPIFVCPSIGVPIPNTASLSNPVAVEHHDGTNNGGNVAIGQMDPNGTYIPTSSTGTYVICIDAKGTPYAKYWEGFVDAVFAPAKWNPDTHQEELIGPASFKFTKKQGG